MAERVLRLTIDPRQARVGAEAYNRSLRAIEAQVRRLESRLNGQDRTLNRQGQATQKLAAQNRALAGSFNLVAGAVGGLSLGAAARGVTGLASEFERLEIRLRFASGGAEEGARNFAFLEQETERLGQRFVESAQQASLLFGAGRGQFDQNTLRELILGALEGSTALGLTAQETNGILLALQQIISKGRVSAEELRRQLGDRLPGAFSLAADAIGVTTEELSRLLERGELAAQEFIPVFARAMRNEFAAAAVEASNTIERRFDRIVNAARRVGETVGSEVAPAFADALEALTEFGEQEEVLIFLTSLGELTATAVENLDKLLPLLVSLAGLAASRKLQALFAFLAGNPGAIAGITTGAIATSIGFDVVETLNSTEKLLEVNTLLEEAARGNAEAQRELNEVYKDLGADGLRALIRAQEERVALLEEEQRLAEEGRDIPVGLGAGGGTVAAPGGQPPGLVIRGNAVAVSELAAARVELSALEEELVRVESGFDGMADAATEGAAALLSTEEAADQGGVAMAAFERRLARVAEDRDELRLAVQLTQDLGLEAKEAETAASLLLGVDSETTRQRVTELLEEVKELRGELDRFANDPDEIPLSELPAVPGDDFPAASLPFDNPVLTESQFDALLEKFLETGKANKEARDNAEELRKTFLQLGNTAAQALGTIDSDAGRAATAAIALYEEWNRVQDLFVSLDDLGAGFSKRLAAGATAGLTIGSLVGGVIGGSSNLAAEGAALGGAVGGAIAASLSGGLGAEAGALIGTAIGGVAGSLFSTGSPQATGALGLVAGEFIANINELDSEVSSAFRQLINGAVEALNNVLDEIDAEVIGSGALPFIKIRDGIITVVSAGITQSFTDANEALEAIVLAQLRSANLEGASENVLAAIANSGASTLDGLLEDLQLALDIDALNLPPLQRELRNLSDAYLEQRDRAEQLRLDVQALDAAFAGEDLQERINQLLGIQPTVEEQIRAGADAILGEIDYLRTELEGRLAAALAELARLTAIQSAGISSAGLDVTTGLGDMGAALGAFGLTIGATADVSADAIAELQATIAGLEAALAGLPTITEDQIQDAINRGTSSSNRGAQRDALSEQLRRARDAGLDPLIQSFRQLTADTARWEEEARKLGLAQEEVAATTAAVRERLLEELDARIAAFGAIGGDSVTDQIREIEEERDALLSSIAEAFGFDSAFADNLATGLENALVSVASGSTFIPEEALAAIQAVLDAFQARLADIEAQVTSQIDEFDPFKEATSSIDDVRQTADDLRDAVRGLGEKSAETADELARIGEAEAFRLQQIEVQVFERLFSFLEATTENEEERLRIARTKVELEFALIRAQLEALGLFEEFTDLFNQAFADAIAAAETGVRDDTLANLPTVEVDDFADELRAAQQTVADFRDELLSTTSSFDTRTPEQRLAEGFAELQDLVGLAGQNDIDALNAIPSAVNAFLQLAQDSFGSGVGFQQLLDAVNALLASLGALPTLQQGGVTNGLSFAGEAGPELVVPLDNGDVRMKLDLRGFAVFDRIEVLLQQRIVQAEDHLIRQEQIAVAQMDQADVNSANLQRTISSGRLRSAGGAVPGPTVSTRAGAA